MVNVTFRNFEDNATRKTSALSYLMYTSVGVSTENTVERAKFVNAKPVYFPPIERKWQRLSGPLGVKIRGVFTTRTARWPACPNYYVLINDHRQRRRQ